MRWLFAAPIKLYQLLVSPFLPRHCNYTPTCSQYTLNAIFTYGPLRGILAGMLRLGRCWGRYRGGDDPVPAVFSLKLLLKEYRDRRR